MGKLIWPRQIHGIRPAKRPAGLTLDNGRYITKSVPCAVAVVEGPVSAARRQAQGEMN